MMNTLPQNERVEAERGNQDSKSSRHDTGQRFPPGIFQDDSVWLEQWNKWLTQGLQRAVAELTVFPWAWWLKENFIEKGCGAWRFQKHLPGLPLKLGMNNEKNGQKAKQMKKNKVFGYIEKVKLK